MPVARIAGDGEPAEIGAAFSALPPIGVGEDPEALEEVAADIRALVAGDAAERREPAIALLLVPRNRVARPAEKAVEARVRGDERALIGGERVQHRLPLGRRAVDRLESFEVARIGAQLGEQLVPTGVHDARVEQDRLVLLLESSKVAAPVEAEVEGSVEDGRRVEVERRAVRPLRPRLSVPAAMFHRMAGDAGEVVAARKPDVVEERLAEAQLLRLCRGRRRDRRDRLRANGARRPVGREIVETRDKDHREQRWNDRAHAFRHWRRIERRRARGTQSDNAREGRECRDRWSGMPVSRRVLAVDDDPAMRNMIAEYLRGENFEVRTAADGAEMSRILAETAIDLVILDLQLADEDGLDLVRTLSAQAKLPIVVLTGHRRDEFDRVLGLELGADDYMTKPFSLRELGARVRAVLRRRDAAARRPPPDDTARRYRFAGWELDLRTRRLASPTGEPVPLTKGEFNLLRAFLEAPQRVLSREQLILASRVHEEEVYDRSIDVQILRLRRKLEPDPANPRLIRTERGVGYLLAADVEKG